MKRVKGQGSLRLKRILALALNQFKDPYYQGSAPQLSFFLFLSVVPIILLISQFLGLFNLSLAEIQEWANIDITGANAGILEELINTKPLSHASIFLVVMALWGGSRVEFCIVRISNYTFTDGLKTGKGWLLDRSRAILLTIIIMITFSFSLVFMVYLPTVLKLLIGFEKAGEVLDSVWIVIRWPVMLAIYFLFISWVFFLAPDSKIPYRNVIPGSLFTSVGLLLATFLFNKYNNINIANNVIYGALTSVIMLALWFWLISWVLILGITVNRLWWATSYKNPKPLHPRVFERRMVFQIRPIQKYIEKYTDYTSNSDEVGLEDEDREVNN